MGIGMYRNVEKRSVKDRIRRREGLKTSMYLAQQPNLVNEPRYFDSNG